MEKSSATLQPSIDLRDVGLAALGIACGLASWTVVAVGVGLTVVVMILLTPLDSWIARHRRTKDN